MKRWVTSAAVGTAIVAYSATQVNATAISINPQYASTDKLASSTYAGVVPVDNWNNVTAGENGNSSNGWGTSTDPIALTDDSGNPDAAYAYSSTINNGQSGFITSPSTGDQQMMDSWSQANRGQQGNAPFYINVSGLSSAFTSSGYDIYVYTDSDDKAGAGNHYLETELNAGGTGTVTSFSSLSGGTSTIVYAEDQDAVFDGTYVATGGSSTTTATPGNYIEFTNVNASSFWIIFQDTQNEVPSGINGIEIVAVPEPASLGFLSLLGALCLRRRRS